MDNLMKIYNHLPIFAQNFATTLEGYRLKNQRYGENSTKYIKDLEKDQWLSEENLKEIQFHKLQLIIKHAYLNIPYYRRLFDNIGFKPDNLRDFGDLKKIPVLRKETIKNNIKDFIATNLSKLSLISHTTGGTTGTPLKLYTTKDAIQYNFACGEARHKRWADVKSGDKLASFLGRVIVPIDTKKPPFWRYNRAYNQMIFSSYHMNEKNLKFYTEEFNRFRPTIVQGYVSTVLTMAKYILDHKRMINPPKAILLSSETLFDWQRDIIERAFGAKVFNGYSGAEEVAFISECKNGGLHISPEFGFIEFSKVEGTNNMYEIIGTNLFNLAMPLIRYSTGDIVELFDEQKRCPCGRKLPLVKSILGRNDSMLVTPEGSYISSASMSLVFTSEYLKNIIESQIIQLKPNEIIVRLVSRSKISENELSYIRERFMERLGKNMKISFEFPKDIEKTKMGKYRFIVSNISNV